MKPNSLIVAIVATAKVVSAFATNDTTPLREIAEKKGILIGSGATNPALSPENELKWSFINPSKGYYNWSTIDRLVAKHDMVVKGHGLISSCCNPDYVANMTDPTELRAALTEHFEAVMHRYRGKLDRWDVVTEALETQGGALQNNIFNQVLGPDYIEEAFRIARAADANAKLFINETLVESLPGKRQEPYDLVSKLVANNVPIDGVALQMHITEVPPTPGVITEMVSSYKALGLEVTMAEMDVHTLNDTLQTEIYGSVIKEALDAGITDISCWRFTDKHLYTWLPGVKPLMFDEEYKPKGVFYAVQESLENSKSAFGEL